MEKSSWNAEVTSTKAARNTRAKVAIPARRAVSPNRSELEPGRANASAPARNEYALNANASRSAKLPICDMNDPRSYFFRNNRRKQSGSRDAQIRRTRGTH